MQFTLPLLALALAVNAQGAAEVQEINVVLSDIGAHQADYLSWVQEGHLPPNGVLGLYQQISTYTDNSYTTLYAQLDQAAISTYVTGLPWYSSRILPALGGAGGSASTPKETGSSAAPSSASTPKETSSSAAPSSAPNSMTTHQSSIPEVSSFTNAAGQAFNAYAGDNIAYALAPLFALGVPLLL